MGDFKWRCLLFFLFYPMFHAHDFPVFSKVTDLPLDENEHLESHWLLFPRSCFETPEGFKMTQNVLPGRKIALVDGELSDLLKITDICPVAVALEMGTEPKYFEHHVDRYDGDIEKFGEWLDQIAHVEAGWINFADKKGVTLYWVSETGDEVKQYEIAWGEPKTHWRTVYLDHKFRVRDSNGEIVREMVAIRNEVFILGTQPPLEEEFAKPRDRTREFEDTDRYENRRSKKVKRTFTEHGFNKVRVPEGAYGSIRAYYYNNRKNLAREDWGGKGLYVNWWEVDPLMIQPPFGLKRKWHDALKPLAEEWVGYELEETDLYGMRRYEKGAKLLKHVDREATHAVSMIVNVDQSEDLNTGAVGPWQLDITDHRTDKAQLVTMTPGDMVFYESAKCMHGRPEALQGDYYVNLFVHYRPVGQPKWYEEEKATIATDKGPQPLEEVLLVRGETPPEGEPKPEVRTLSIGKGIMHLNSLFYETSKATHRAKGKFSARIEQHAKAAHIALQKRILKEKKLSFMHSWVVAVTPDGSPLIIALCIFLALCICCCLVRGTFSDAPLPTKAQISNMTPNISRKPNAPGKKSDDSGGKSGFGDWDASKALSHRLDPKIRAAAASGNLSVIKNWVAQVEKNPTTEQSLDIGDANDRTVLHLAAKSGHDDIVRLMLSKGCDPNPQDRSRSVTPLHLAAMEGRGPCVKLLLDHGASLFMEDIDRATPLQLAKASGNTGCTILLEKAEASANDKAGFN